MAEAPHAPSARKLAWARGSGLVPVSRTCVAVIALLATASVVAAMAERGTTLWRQLCKEALDAAFAPTPLLAEGALALGASAARLTLDLITVPLLVAFAAAVVVALVQTRGALRRIFPSPTTPTSSSRRLAVIGTLVVASLSAPVLWSLRGDLTRAAHFRDAGALLRMGGQVTGWLVLRLGVMLLLWAGIDVGWQWWSWRRRLRMTPREQKEEVRREEGDPRVRAERQRVARELAAGKSPP